MAKNKIVIRKEFLYDFMQRKNITNEEIGKREMKIIMANFIKDRGNLQASFSEIMNMQEIVFE